MGSMESPEPVPLLGSGVPDLGRVTSQGSAPHSKEPPQFGLLPPPPSSLRPGVGSWCLGATQVGSVVRARNLGAIREWTSVGGRMFSFRSPHLKELEVLPGTLNARAIQTRITRRLLMTVRTKMKADRDLPLETRRPGWSLSVSGDKPTPRFNHAATVVDNKMIVVGGESGSGLLDDVQVLNFTKFSWSGASSKIYLSPSSLPIKIPPCKGHSLVSWGKKVLLVGGRTEPGSDRLSVWAFDTETEGWSLMEAKGDIPVSRGGHTVVRANSALILFGGEDGRRRKLNDLHMFDLKSSTWLPLNCTGMVPSARCNHVATLYNNKTLFIFGGSSKSKSLNDIYSLDFETMIWSRIKIRGSHPSPRFGCCGVLCGTKWYIAGGGSRKKRFAETLIFDVLKFEWSVAAVASPSSVSTNKGFSMVLVQHNEKSFLVAFGGIKRELSSNQVEALFLDKINDSAGLRPAAARHNLVTANENYGSGRKSLSECTPVEPRTASGNVSLRKQVTNEEENNRSMKIANLLEDKSSASQTISRELDHSDAEIHAQGAGGNSFREETYLDPEPDISSPGVNHNATKSLLEEDDNLVSMETSYIPGDPVAASSIYKFYEGKIASLLRKNGMLEGQLAAALANQKAVEKSFSAVLKSKQETEKKLADAMKEMEFLNEKLSNLELTQEEAGTMSNIVHSDNVRLEHDVAFLKAVLDDTQKELHSTRGILAGERARTFQLQVEVFHLKQRLQSIEARIPTPRKPYV
ncbi:hypothetical protein MLD38_023561 [Melastoma candidum]|uniref:Uncharacterized protein n=1 Tax=Melastoma candidum TaxID=119954 RepID=A0ACB9NQJ4_9MYRT|nr:hypothetical protein MLD38_023561 [Melastoma candidum]